MAKQQTAVKGRVQVGDQAPDFTLATQSGDQVNLKDFLGKSNVVLYFYPADNTSICTAEACAFRDSYEVFKDAGAEVIGISSNSEASHQQFAAKHRLPFILLSDPHGVIRKHYGVPARFGLIPGRVTYIIDKQGVVRHLFTDQFHAKTHVAEALKTLETLRGEQEA
ncbi:MAG TPA: peroxiredoxin [Ktedonobacterales bacterium]